ncbi:MAG: hypothetical protein ACODAU_10230 [Myxococcota bacterium]
MSRTDRGGWCVLAALLLCGCGGAAPGPSAPQAAAPDPASAHDAVEPETPDAFLEASATGPSEEAAYRAAVRRLEVALYGTAGWAELAGAPVHDPEGDPTRLVPEDGAARAVVGLTRETVRGHLEALPDRLAVPDAPAWLADSLEEALRVHAVRLACERRRALLDADCEPVDTDGVDAEVRTLALSILIEPKYEGGVPLDDARRPLRAPAVVARRVGAQGGLEPVRGLWLRARWAGEADEEGEGGGLERRRVRTGADGQAAFPLAEEAAWPGTLRIEVDAGAWLGPLARLWAGQAVRVDGRATNLRRWGALVTERVGGSGAPDGIFADALRHALDDRGAAGAVSLRTEHRERLERAHRAGRLERVLPEVADDLGGRLDVLLVAEVDSEFASRMGTSRVWYEARGRVRALDAWTGSTLATVESAVTEPGVGDRRADRAARQGLGRALAEALLQAVEGDPAVADVR